MPNKSTVGDDVARVVDERVHRVWSVIVVRGGVVPAGGVECVGETLGQAFVVGDGVAAAAVCLRNSVDGVVPSALTLVGLEMDPNDRLAIAARLRDEVAGDYSLVLPASPDGRDLAPVLAEMTGRPLFSNCVTLGRESVRCVRGGGRAMVQISVSGPAVFTFQSFGSRISRADDNGRAPSGDAGVDGADGNGVEGSGVEGGGVEGGGVEGSDIIRMLEPVAASLLDEFANAAGHPDISVSTPDARRLVETIVVHPPDAATIDLAESDRIIGLGDGAGGAAAVAVASDVAEKLGCTVGATRVVTDAGLIGHDRQIGTTGVVVAPDLYLAFGVSGAVQHTAGLGDPDHIISINTDPHCPMMQMADLAIVADALATAEALRDVLAGTSTDPDATTATENDVVAGAKESRS